MSVFVKSQTQHYWDWPPNHLRPSCTPPPECRRPRKVNYSGTVCGRKPSRKFFFLKTCSNPHKMVLNRKRIQFLVRQKHFQMILWKIFRDIFDEKIFHATFFEIFWSKVEKSKISKIWNFEVGWSKKVEKSRKIEIFVKKSKIMIFIENRNFRFFASKKFSVEFFLKKLFGTPSLKWPNSKTTWPISKILIR